MERIDLTAVNGAAHRDDRPVDQGAGQNRYLSDFPLIFCLNMSSA
jgi:hypothetical protein